MKILRRVCIVLLSLLIVALVVFYGLWARHASTQRILVVKDASDIATLRGSPLQATYDPYFNRVNFTRDIKLPPTNSGSAGSKPN
jgi:hypothetical protein